MVREPRCHIRRSERRACGFPLRRAGSRDFRLRCWFDLKVIRARYVTLDCPLNALGRIAGAEPPEPIPTIESEPRRAISASRTPTISTNANEPSRAKEPRHQPSSGNIPLFELSRASRSGEMVPRDGVEPPTLRFSGGSHFSLSINLALKRSSNPTSTFKDLDHFRQTLIGLYVARFRGWRNA